MIPANLRKELARQTMGFMSWLLSHTTTVGIICSWIVTVWGMISLFTGTINLCIRIRQLCNNRDSGATISPKNLKDISNYKENMLEKGRSYSVYSEKRLVEFASQRCHLTIQITLSACTPGYDNTYRAKSSYVSFDGDLGIT